MAAPTALAEAESPAAHAREDGPRADVGFRYGAVLALSLTVVVFLVAAPAGDWSRAFGLALELTALVVVVVTSNERERVRRHRNTPSSPRYGTGTGVLNGTVAYPFNDRLGDIIRQRLPATSA